MLKEYRATLRTVVYAMVLNLVWIIFFLMVFPLPEETEDSMGAGGGIMCFVMWIGLMVLFSASLLWVVVKGNEIPMFFGCVLSWLFFIGIISLEYSLWMLMLNSLVPLALTVALVRMFRLTEKMQRVRGELHPIDYPVARRRREELAPLPAKDDDQGTREDEEESYP